MTLKEKLELLWKYLFLAVIVFALVQIGRTHKSRVMHHDFQGKHGSKMMWYSDEDCDTDEMKVDVEIEKFAGGDSVIKVIINGETMDLEDLEKLDENVFIKKMKHDGSSKERKVKIIKKVISDK
ncbi:MAG: hypothetical protein H8E26_09495 [FCB group bacterium]|nr:hypothetical protein [FCB group bacterium]MBL7029143.1 hypothetical protein [Candidatus Neomarinimicrobiota bacterium]MBL7122054.1 hypothetical protein [Candidatus Neomarinimicrobiota bacterium]